MKILFTGDSVIQNINNFSISPSPAEFINQHNFKITNFEGTLKGKTTSPIKKIGPNVYNCNEAVSLLKENGFNCFTLANNHIVDFGAESCIETMKKINDENIRYVGAGTSFEDCYAPLVIEENNQKIALINCCHAEFGVYKDKNLPLKAGYAWINSREIDRQIIKCKSEGYYVIVLPHAGVEFQEIPLPEWRERYQNFIDLGADIVIGSHPHIIQGKETYKGKSIYYSLGNFSFYNQKKIDDKEWNTGLLVSLDTESGITSENFISYDGKKVDLCNDASVREYFEKRSKILKNPDEYNAKVIEMITKLWNCTYKELYDAVPNFINARNHFIKNLIKYFAKKYLFRNRFQKDLNETLLLHNIQIESHRYAVERYLYLQNIKINDLGDKND